MYINKCIALIKWKNKDEYAWRIHLCTKTEFVPELGLVAIAYYFIKYVVFLVCLKARFVRPVYLLPTICPLKIIVLFFRDRLVVRDACCNINIYAL